MSGPGSMPPSDDLAESVGSLALRLTDAVSRNDADDADRVADALLLLDDATLADGDPAIVRDLLNAGAALMGGGDLGRVERLFVKGIDALERNPRAGEVELVVVLNNLIALHEQTGDLAARDRAAAAIEAVAQRLGGPLTPDAVAVFAQLGHAYERQGNLDGALTFYRQVHRSMVARIDVDRDLLDGWVLRYVTTLSAAGRHTEALDVGRRALESLGASGPEDRAAAVRLGLTIARAATAGAQLDAAEAALEKAVGAAEALVGDGPAVEAEHLALAGAAYHNLAAAYLERGRSDRYRRADELVRRALEIVVRTGGEGSGEHAGELGQLGVIAERQGDVEAAERCYVRSVEVYERAPDTVPGHFFDFLTDLGLLRLRDGRAAEALAPLRRAVELADAAQEDATRRADALSNLATAHFESGELDQASHDYARAIDLRLGD